MKRPGPFDEIIDSLEFDARQWENAGLKETAKRYRRAIAVLKAAGAIRPESFEWTKSDRFERALFNAIYKAQEAAK